MTCRQQLQRTGGKLAAWILGAVMLATGSVDALAGKPYRYYAVGDPLSPVASLYPEHAATCSWGGGLEVDEAFRWMIRQAGIARGSGGRFVIIRATGDDAYNRYLVSATCPYATYIDGESLGLSSVETLVIPSREAANDDWVNTVVARANVLWIAGGDQSDYINFWKGTRLDETLQRLLRNRVPFGGLSAGLAVLGQFDYAAQRSSVTSAEALADPYSKNVTLDPAPLALTGGFIAPPDLAALAGAITDTHLDTRDRMGRLITFVARLVAPYASAGSSPPLGCPGGVLPVSQVRGVGVSIQTALLLEQDLSGRVRAQVMANPPDPTTLEERAAYLVSMTEGATVCAPGWPLSIRNGQVQIRKLLNGDQADFSDWSKAPLYNNLRIDRGMPTDKMLD
jgi:cyanophycinase-like exopeptidase